MGFLHPFFLVFTNITSASKRFRLQAECSRETASPPPSLNTCLTRENAGFLTYKETTPFHFVHLSRQNENVAADTTTSDVLSCLPGERERKRERPCQVICREGIRGNGAAASCKSLLKILNIPYVN